MIKYDFFIYWILLGVVTACSPKPPLNNGAEYEPVKDIVIHKASGYRAPCEPTICISPKDPNIVIAGSVLDNVYISTNGGETWYKDRLTSPYGVYGDPVIRIAPNGTIYYSHLSNPDNKAYQSVSFLDRIVVQSSTDIGKTWTPGYAPPGDTLKDHDKQWLTIDPFDESIIMSWTEFDKYGSKDPKDKSRILFSRSADEGRTWSSPVVVSQEEGNCMDDDDTTEGCTPAVGVDGTYYLTWSYNNRIFFDKSIDKGRTWMASDQVIAAQPGGWTYDIPGISRCNGMPIIEVDHSNGPHRGRIYVNWSDQRNGSDNTDIWLIHSDDKGATWSQPKMVNNDSSKKHQFLTWMDVDPSTGHIYIVFYDRRAHDDNTTDVYVAYSTDGGKRFTNLRVNETSFIPEAHSVFFGDYNDISAYANMVRPIWTQQDGTELSIHTAILNFK